MTRSDYVDLFFWISSRSTYWIAVKKLWPAPLKYWFAVFPYKLLQKSLEAYKKRLPRSIFFELFFWTPTGSRNSPEVKYLVLQFCQGTLYECHRLTGLTIIGFRRCHPLRDWSTEWQTCLLVWLYIQLHIQLCRLTMGSRGGKFI